MAFALVLQVIEDLLDHHRILNAGNDPDWPAAGLADLNSETEVILFEYGEGVRLAEKAGDARGHLRLSEKSGDLRGTSWRTQQLQGPIKGARAEWHSLT